MAKLSGLYNASLGHQRRQLCLCGPAVYAGDMPALPLQRWRLKKGIQPDHRGVIPTAAGYRHTARTRNERGGVGNAASVIESLQACHIRKLFSRSLCNRSQEEVCNGADRFHSLICLRI